MEPVVYTQYARRSKKGVVYAPGSAADGYIIWKLCENYDGRARGGISKTWRYVERGLSLDEAKALFERRLGYRVYS